MTPIPVVTIAEPIVCNLPELPMPAEPIGMATPQGIVVTKSDLAGVAAEIMGLREWIRSAAICIGGAR